MTNNELHKSLRRVLREAGAVGAIVRKEYATLIITSDKYVVRVREALEISGYTLADTTESNNLRLIPILEERTNDDDTK